MERAHNEARAQVQRERAERQDLLSKISTEEIEAEVLRRTFEKNNEESAKAALRKSREMAEDRRDSDQAYEESRGR